MGVLSSGLIGLPARRKAAGLTQEAFADALGVTRSALAAWETGRAWPSASILPQIADLLLCSIDDLYKLPPEGVVIEIPMDRVDPAALELIQRAASDPITLYPEHITEDGD